VEPLAIGNFDDYKEVGFLSDTDPKRALLPHPIRRIRVIDFF